MPKPIRGRPQSRLKSERVQCRAAEKGKPKGLQARGKGRGAKPRATPPATPPATPNDGPGNRAPARLPGPLHLLVRIQLVRKERSSRRQTSSRSLMPGQRGRSTTRTREKPLASSAWNCGVAESRPSSPT